MSERTHRSTAEARTALTAMLTGTIPGLAADDAVQALQQARAWHTHALFELHDHLADTPDALTSGSSDCPKSLVRLVHTLIDAELEGLTAPGCVRCGKAARTLDAVRDGGRLCPHCYQAEKRTTCVRCGKATRANHRRDDGLICRSCRDAEPDSRGKCPSCGQDKALRSGPDGTQVCDTCLPKPLETCLDCGKERPIAARTPEGPRCGHCHAKRTRTGTCRQCGNERILSRSRGLCTYCAHQREDTCAACGRVRRGHRSEHGKGVFLCQTCAPKRETTCVRCGQCAQPWAHWPDGPVCGRCYKRARSRPGPCQTCGETRVLVGSGTEGTGICGECVKSTFTYRYRCSRCGQEHQSRTGLCQSCTADDAITAALGTDGAISPDLAPLADVLRRIDQPRDIINWLRRPAVADILAALARTGPITHQTLDGLEQTDALHQIRYRLIACGILPERTEFIARYETWLNDYLTGLPAHHRRILHPYARWHLLARARRRAPGVDDNPYRGNYLRTHTRIIAAFLAWIDEHDSTLKALTQSDLERWLTEHGSYDRYRVRPFLHWAQRRGQADDVLTVPDPGLGPERLDPLSEDEVAYHLDRCLHEDQIPLNVRLAGALKLVYGFTAPQLVRLTVDAIDTSGPDTTLTAARTPILLPPALADLAIAYLESDRDRSLLSKAVGPTTYLFPGNAAAQPLRPVSLHRLLQVHGIPNIRARDAALLALTRDLPSPVLADLLGLHTATLERWATHATRDWNDYLRARMDEP